MTTAIQTQSAQPGALATISPETMEALVVGGDLRKLSAAQRLEVYRARCDAAGIDPRTQPFQYLDLQGKLTLYATKTATDQIIAARSLTVAITDRKIHADLGVIEATCRVTFPDGRSVEDVGVVSLGSGAKGDVVANAIMKAVTKAKRRTVLSACGLGMLDETERETIPGARDVVVDAQGEIIDTTATTVVDRGPSFTTDPNAPKPEGITEDQSNTIAQLMERAGWSPTQLRGYFETTFHKAKRAELTKQQAAAAIVYLEGLPAAQPEEPKPPVEEAPPKASNEQLSKIAVLVKNTFGDVKIPEIKAKVQAWLKQLVGKESRAQLNKAEASKVIEALMELEAQLADAGMAALPESQPTIPDEERAQMVADAKRVEAELLPPEEGDAF